MNWVNENKFLAGSAVLGYLLYSAWGSYSDVTDQYNELANALHQLQVRVPYPDQANLTKYKAERDDLIDATHDLAARLSGLVLPVVEMTPSAFQDRLRDTVSAVVTEAQETNVQLPQHFSMDFEKYQTSPPAPEAAGPLGRQLAALKIVMDILIHERVDSVLSLDRVPLPQEGGGAHLEHGGGKFGHGGEESSGGGALVEKFPFELRFTANQPAFQKVLNDLAASGSQFFITRTLLIENTDPKPVAKEPAGAPAPPPPQPFAAGAATDTSGAPGGPAGGAYLKFIVGTEKLDVAMRVDMVAFNAPEKSARKEAAHTR
jgi:hypothetical protein